MIGDKKSLLTGTIALMVLSTLIYVGLGSITLFGKPTPEYMAAASVVMGLLFLSAALLAVNQSFASRLQTLRKQIVDAGIPEDIFRPEGRAPDEFTGLKADITRLVESLNAFQNAAQDSRSKIERSEAELALTRAGLAKTNGSQKGSELHRSVDLFAHAFEASQLGLAILTARDGCFLEVNERFLDFIGHNRNDVIAQTDQELRIWENDQVRNQFFGQLTTEAPVKAAEGQLRHKSGDFKNAVISLIRIELDETPCLVFTIQDPEEHSKLEARRLQTQKMDAVGQLAAGLAHDFNNILMIIQGYTSLLLADKSLDPGSNQALEQVSVAADRAAQLTRQLLAFSRKQIMHPKTVQLNETLVGMRDVLEQMLGPEIEIKWGLDPNVPQIEADNTMIAEGITTLATNARDALSKGGQLFIGTSTVEIDAGNARQKPEARPGTFTCLTLRDNGTGMDPATVSRVFEPFFTTKETGKGTGLGLATVYGIVKQHNGWIEVSSQPGQGTTFNIFLQASAKAAPSPALPPAKATKLNGKERVLVVEDEPGLRALVQGILQHYGYDVVTASSGTEGLSAWHDHNGEFDLVLTDMVMPEGMSGRQLAEKLWMEKPDLKVIFTSGYSVDLLGDDAGAFVEGVNFLQKPYRPKGLAESVRRCLGHHNPTGDTHFRSSAA